MPGKKVQAEKLQVIPAGEGKWLVPSGTKEGVVYEVQLVDNQLRCNCPAGWNGKWCKHKQAVTLIADANHKEEEQEIAGQIEGQQKGGKMDQKPRMTRHGYRMDEVTSAIQKLIRAGDEEKAIFFALELYDVAPFYLIKRLLIIASEDIGLADPQTVGIVNQLATGWAEAKKLSWYVSPHQPIQMVMMLCRAKKSTEVEDAISLMKDRADRGWRPEIPEIAIDQHTQKGKELGKAAGKTRDQMDADWYRGRVECGMPTNPYLEQLKQERPDWFPKGGK